MFSCLCWHIFYRFSTNLKVINKSTWRRHTQIHMLPTAYFAQMAYIQHCINDYWTLSNEWTCWTLASKSINNICTPIITMKWSISASKNDIGIAPRVDQIPFNSALLMFTLDTDCCPVLSHADPILADNERCALMLKIHRREKNCIASANFCLFVI